ncbi:GTP-binding protein YPTC4 [Orchesella cincta]|uniref:GTP-binding protein YPTC4 n=1 Tax=Orchesella cincta TaxID=48709 RepID=A0A1D2NJL0_ORCCI|nr:GTP-binding protein YPTC4 [Orchesella cincta]
MSQDFFLKYIIVGNTSVGKSAILHRFIKNDFKSDTIATVGVDYKARNINVEDKSIGLMIWDTAGMEAYRSFTQAYYRSSAVAIFVYDITKKETFTAIPGWIQLIRQNCPDNPHLVTVIVGNKSDLEQQRAVDSTEGDKMAKEHKSLFFEASAVTGDNIDEIFEKAAQQCFEKYKDGDIDITNDTFGFLLGPRQLEICSTGGETSGCSC